MRRGAQHTEWPQVRSPRPLPPRPPLTSATFAARSAYVDASIAAFSALSLATSSPALRCRSARRSASCCAVVLSDASADRLLASFSSASAIFSCTRARAGGGRVDEQRKPRGGPPHALTFSASRAFRSVSMRGTRSRTSLTSRSCRAASVRASSPPVAAASMSDICSLRTDSARASSASRRRESALFSASRALRSVAASAPLFTSVSRSVRACCSCVTLSGTMTPWSWSTAAVKSVS